MHTESRDHGGYIKDRTVEECMQIEERILRSAYWGVQIEEQIEERILRTAY